MTSSRSVTIILFQGVNKVTLPQNAQLSEVETDGYEVSLVFKTEGEQPTTYRQFYVAFNSASTDYTQGVLRLIKQINFADGTSVAVIYPVYA